MMSARACCEIWSPSLCPHHSPSLMTPHDLSASFMVVVIVVAADAVFLLHHCRSLTSSSPR